MRDDLNKLFIWYRTFEKRFLYLRAYLKFLLFRDINIIGNFIMILVWKIYNGVLILQWDELALFLFLYSEIRVITFTFSRLLTSPEEAKLMSRGAVGLVHLRKRWNILCWHLWSIILASAIIKCDDRDKSEIFWVKFAFTNWICRFSRALISDNSKNFFQAKLYRISRFSHIVDDHVQEYFVVYELFL